MKYEKYQIETDKKLLVFEFTSVGTKGEIKKLVQFTEINLKNYYNLGFGDKDEATGNINDTIITNNGDSKKVLATVVLTIYFFTQKHPNAFIHIKGSNTIRTRLYRMGITNNISAIKKDFFIFGLKNDGWQKFKKGIEYGVTLKIWG